MKNDTEQKCSNATEKQDGCCQHNDSGACCQAEEECCEKNTEEQLAELTDLLKRTQANFENYRKQIEKRMEEQQLFATRSLLMDILPVIDTFDLALKNSPSKELELIYTQMQGVLKQQGVEAWETDGTLFDPLYHEALLKEESDLPEGTILETYQRCFTLHGKVLRHARVKISAGKTTTEKTEEQK